ncbi:alpha/beta hydrolase [Leucobacter sp. W1153]|uniref:alpha/beta hydrolase n=1 Tax=Leucobacter sp. W1153 TaxID=3439064 RepID=UPI003F30E64B
MSIIPASADAVLPDDSPILGCSDEPSAVARYLGKTEAGVAQYRGSLQQAQHTLGRTQSEGVEEIALVVSQRLTVGALALTQTLSTARSAFERYAAEVDRIHSAARQVRGRVEDSLAVIRGQHGTIEEICGVLGVRVDFEWRAGPPPVMPDPTHGLTAQGAMSHMGADGNSVEVLAMRARYEPLWAAAVSRWRGAVEFIVADAGEWRRLCEDRQAAEATLMSALSSTALGQLIAVGQGSTAARRSAVAYGVSGELWGSTRPPVTRSTEHASLTKLIGARTGAGIWQNPPDPVGVAESWDALSPAEQQQLVSEVPWVVGNLPGLPFSVRDQANRRLLEYYVLHHDALSPDCVELLRELTAVLHDDTEDPPATLVALNLNGNVPMVAVGYGPLDESTSLTWEVPGMLSDAHLALGTWHHASRNLHGAQQRLLKPAIRGGRAQGDSERAPAVVAFLSYDTPNLLSVLSAQSARVGARRLAAELDGAAATRGHGVPLPIHAVVAHSYGTPVAANALTETRHPVQSFTMLGSAGLDHAVVKSFMDLNVVPSRPGAPGVFTTLAAGDQLAPFGAALSDRAQPNPQAVSLGQIHIPGAYVFGSDGFGSMRSTDGHSVIGTGARGSLGSNASLGHGYLDRGTQSLVGTAAASLGAVHRLPGGLTHHGELVGAPETLCPTGNEIVPQVTSACSPSNGLG